MATAVKNTRVEFSLRDGMKKSEISAMATAAVDGVLEKGNILQIAETLAVMDHFAKEVKKDPRFPDYVREELAKNGGKFTSASGAKLEACEAGTTYDYSNNPEWVRLSADAEAAVNARKELEKRLQTIPAGKQLVDGETGEALIGPAKSSISTYKVTLAK
jgi:hypothetical protein